jgi:hypothetical protein
VSEENVEPSQALKAFRSASLKATEAFNRHDFDVAFATLPPDIEWHPLDKIPGAHLLRGRDEVISWFRQIVADFPDFRSQNLEFSEPVPGAFIVRFENEATGRASGAAVSGPAVFQLWEVAATPWRVREFSSRREALEAAGSSE